MSAPVPTDNEGSLPGGSGEFAEQASDRAGGLQPRLS
jgi:hypothetical protein